MAVSKNLSFAPTSGTFPRMSEPLKETPQFRTAEYAGGDICKMCKQPVGASYYRVSGEMTCAACAEKAKSDLPSDTHSAFTRALCFGLGGALLGLILYSAVGIITGLEIGYVSLAVGYIVGKAMKAGSKGLGGRRYQIAAVLLTYAAVSLAAVPISIAQIIKEKPAAQRTGVQRSSSAPSGAVAEQTTSPAQESTTKKPMSAGAALLTLVAIGLASPLLGLQDPVHGLIGLVILLVGIRIAWQITDGTPVHEIVGPFSNTVKPST